MCLIHKFKRCTEEFFVNRLHSLAREGAAVLGSPVGEAVDHAARAKAFTKLRIQRIVRILWLFLGIQVVQVAKELIKTVLGGQKFIAVTEVILAELATGITERFQQFSQRRVFRLNAEVSARDAHLGQSSANGVLARDKCGASSGAALLAIIVSKDYPLIGDAIDIGCVVTHHAQTIATDIPVADIIAPNHEDIRLLSGMCCRAEAECPQQEWCKDRQPAIHFFHINTSSVSGT